MDIIVLGLSHKTADVEIREKVAFNKEKCILSMKSLHACPDIEEILILSTCNRVEFFSVVKDIQRGPEKIIDFLSQSHKINRELIEHAIYIYIGRDAVRHVFKVASSLDSMIIGESQILGQLKESYKIALSQKSSGIILNRFIRKAISVAKRIRTDTRIAENAVSISFAAVELAKKIFGSLSSTTSMLIGAGEMAELAARHLLNNGIQRIIIANRTFESAEELACQFNGKAIPFKDLKEELHQTDIIICSTGADDYILTKREISHIMKKRRHKQMFIIDISVPRNIDPEINGIDNVYLYDIDDLQGLVDSNLNERYNEAKKAESIIENEVDTFFQWYNNLDATPTIIALRKRAEEIRRAELKKAMRSLNGIGEKNFKTIDAMTHSIIKKLIHPPTILLRSNEENKEELVALIKRLYGLNENKDDEG